MKYEKYIKTVDDMAAVACHVSDTLWDNPETSFEEYTAVELLTQVLEENGFQVTRNLVGIPTAFKATYGTTGPSLGILAEYDALSGFSQVGGIAQQESIPGKDKGHGCGHNLFAGGSFAAALAVKSYIAETGNGTVCRYRFLHHELENFPENIERAGRYTDFSGHIG